ncbi:MAG: phosphoribosylamine--glycine ligase [Candidatus Firestonebacteria bacterium RIFOXYA2_FULL_40_8]|nr:MAG: phosphoribosylamine--glycine ligase [Candidatus Firestonebacteria bacterium RIFOXYA2_FULL_40_8]
MKILVVGSGGREHAIVWALKKSPKVDKIYCAPGNPGIGELAECVNIKVDNLQGLLDFAKKEQIDITVVGPEIPLSLGIVNLFEGEGLKIFGPSREAALLEASKSFAKEFMRKFSIPTAKYEMFYDSQKAEAIKYIMSQGAPIVIKADGLAAGKGVIVAKTVQEAVSAVEDILGSKIFGSAGGKVVIEEFLDGEEATLLCFVDGITSIPMVSSQDHKRVFDNDEGPNTGGMGAYSPAPVLKKDIENAIINKILYPTVLGMHSIGKPYKGVLYLGIIMTKDGPKVIEYNARFGDPETQVVLTRLKTDLVDIILAVIERKLDQIEVEWESKPAVCIVMASGGYPGKYENGKEITGIKEAEKLGEVVVFHAGTDINNNKLVTNGGRVLGVTALGNDLRQAVDKAYKAVSLINFEKAHYRNDIAKKAFNR